MLIMLFCPECTRLKLGPLHQIAQAFGLCPRTWR